MTCDDTGQANSTRSQLFLWVSAYNYSRLFQILAEQSKAVNSQVHFSTVFVFLLACVAVLSATRFLDVAAVAHFVFGVHSLVLPSFAPERVGQAIGHEIGCVASHIRQCCEDGHARPTDPR